MAIQRPIIEGTTGYVELPVGDTITGTITVFLAQNNQPAGVPTPGSNNFRPGTALKVGTTVPAALPLVEKAVADSVANAGVVMIALETIPELNGTGFVACAGAVRLTLTEWNNVLPAEEAGAGLEVGKEYYLHPTAPGKWTKVRPSAPGQVVKRAGVAIHPEIMIFDPQPGLLQS